MVVDVLEEIKIISDSILKLIEDEQKAGTENGKLLAMATTGLGYLGQYAKGAVDAYREPGDNDDLSHIRDKIVQAAKGEG